MSKIDLIIKPKIGLGEINFGEIPENVTKCMGMPGEAEEINTDDDLKTTILSFENGVTVFLEGLVEPIVSHFDLDNKNATLFEEKVFQMNEKSIVQLMNQQGYTKFEKEEEEWGEMRLTFDEAMMDFYFVDGNLEAVNWGVLINDDGLQE